MKSILDAKGSPIKTRTTTTTASAVVFVSDDAQSWQPVKAFNVPDWVKEPDVMSDMLTGVIVSLEEAGPFYKAKRVTQLSDTTQ
ncbi:MAG: hypothetical protein KDA17_04660 [Candidatus Saccharibacteria bacterium]|nr:hypothetical protein [Candidatus Saccharibacteria bacterium]